MIERDERWPLKRLRSWAEPTPWAEVHLFSMETHQLGQAIGAIVDHLGCKLVSRWEPGKGVIYALTPKDDPL